jgi:hypothetical protein
MLEEAPETGFSVAGLAGLLSQMKAISRPGPSQPPRQRRARPLLLEMQAPGAAPCRLSGPENTRDANSQEPGGTLAGRRHEHAPRPLAAR